MLPSKAYGVPNPDPLQVWDALNELHRQTGCKFILGINLEADDVDLSYRQMKAAQENLDPGSVMYYEIGNEVG